MMINFPPAIIFIIGALLLPLLPRRVRSAAYLVFPVLAFILLLQLEVGASLTVPFLNYELVLSRMDRLSLVFGYVFVIMAFLGGVYSFHLKDTLQQAAALFYAGGSLGVVFAGDLFTLFIFWEIMTISSVFLIWTRRTPQSSRPSRLAYRLFVVLVGRLFDGVESLTMYITRFIIRLSANPAGYLVKARKIAGYHFFGAEQPTPEPKNFDPHRYRLPLWVMMLVVLLSFVFLMVWIINRGISG